MFLGILLISKFMKLIKQEKLDKKITEKYSSEFTLADDGLCLIEIIASAKSWRQNLKSFKSLFKDDDLALTLDRIEITTSMSNKTDVRAAWNGNELKGLLKTVIIAVKLKKGKHVLSFTPDQSPYLKNITISQLVEIDKLVYVPTDNNPAEKGDRRPWLSFIIVNLAVKDLIISAKADKRGRDDDDIKLIIDGEIQKNDPSAGGKKSHQGWYWCGKVSKGEKKEFKQAVNFNGGLHTVDLWADKAPFLYKIELALNEAATKNVRIATVDEPEWTGNFNDDSEQMILARAIFGEGRSLPEKGKIAVGWSIKNRAIDARWDNNYHDVILKPKQYSAFNLNDENLPYARNPFLDKTQIDAWYECYKIAGQVIAGEVQDPTGGANHYYSNYIAPPFWTKKKNAHFKLKIVNTLFYEITENGSSGFIKLFSFLLLAMLMAVGLFLFRYSVTDAKIQRSNWQNVKYRHYFINPKNQEIYVLYLDEQGIVGESRQLTFNQYPKSHLEIFDNNELIGYFQNIHKNGETDSADKEAYYKNYVKLMIKQGENAEPDEVYRGDVHTSYWEWKDNKHVIVYYGCGTHCLYYYLIDVNSKKVEDEGYAYE